MEKRGVARDFMMAVDRSVRIIRDTMAVMLPIVWIAHAEDTSQPRIVETQAPASPEFMKVPLYAFDMHTRLGKRAVALLVRESPRIRDCLTEFVPNGRVQKVAEFAAFYADGAPVTRRLAWSQSTILERLGIEADMVRAGASLEGVWPIVAAVRDQLDQLNGIRRGLLISNGQAAPDEAERGR